MIVKRNTMENKRFYLKCKHRPSFVYDVIYDCGIIEGKQEISKDVVVPLN